MVKKYKKYKWKDLQPYRDKFTQGLKERKYPKDELSKFSILSDIHHWMKTYFDIDGKDYKGNQVRNGLSYGSAPELFWRQLGKDLDIHWSIFHKKEGIRLRKEVAKKYFDILCPRGSWLNVL